MGKKTKIGAVGVIEIASSELRFKIAEGGINKLKYVESLRYNIALGKDTFETGKISFEKLEKICNIIRNFLTVASEYDVTNIKCVAATTLREATNLDYILDLIKIKTTVDVKVIDDIEEKLYIYKLVISLLDDELKESALLVNIGSGSVGVSRIENGVVPFMQNIGIGALRISEIFADVADKTNEFYLVLEEYLETYTKYFNDVLPTNIKNLIVSGNEMELISEICTYTENNFFRYVTRENFTKLYDNVKHMTVDNITLKYSIQTEKAEVLLTALPILNKMLNFTSAKKIVMPMVSLADSVIFQSLFQEELKKINEKFEESVLISAKMLACRYNVSEQQYLGLISQSLKIFNKMKKIHGMGEGEKILLKAAAIVRDIGNYISYTEHDANSYYLLMVTEISGLTIWQRKIIATICLYHTDRTPSITDKEYKELSPKDRVLVSKLCAILRLADALNVNSGRDLNEIEVKLTDDELKIQVATDENLELEEWLFSKRAVFFGEVFGISATLKKKKVSKFGLK